VIGERTQAYESPREVVFGSDGTVPETRVGTTRSAAAATSHSEEKTDTEPEMMPPAGEMMPPLAPKETHLQTQTHILNKVVNKTIAPTPAVTLQPTTAPTARPTLLPTMRPTGSPTAKPPMRCADCVQQFVHNGGCHLWQQGQDAKKAVPEGCNQPGSPMIRNPVCESQLALACGMHKKPEKLVPALEAMAKCSTAQLAQLQSGENGHLGCAAYGGSCVVNVGIPECHCHKGYGGRACDVGPRPLKNSTLPSEALLAADLIHSALNPGTLDKCEYEHNIVDWKRSPASAVDKVLQLLQAKSLRAHNGPTHIVVLEAPETVGWIDSFQFVKADIGGQEHLVHLGFWRQIEPVLEAMGQRITDRLDGDKRLVVTGYGQAGAVANILALYLKRALELEITLITYGAPRVGDYAFATAVSSELHKVQRIVRSGDPYSVVPTTSCKDYFSCLGGEMPYIYYVHAGQQTTLPSPAGHTSLCAHPTFHQEGVDGGLGHIHKLEHSAQAKQCFEQHSIDGYVQAAAKQTPEGSNYICTEPTFVPLPPPPPPPVKVAKKWNIQKPPSLKDWGVRNAKGVLP